ncbi:uncharacterized protein LOC17877816 isoform X3 [Capsella rubella]|uniref:uncharacterized protein LOC17877816 isoform X3 n=1 Tax=Capsella rubella TaxID=81985 RepID=UPI000CD5314D|nr:uncharacterized protein LOC17877816 isoform X3 [Capsella rubella]
MDLALHFHGAYPLIRQGLMRANHLPVRADTPSPRFVLQNSCFEQSLSRIMLQDKASSLSLMGRAKKGYVCCKKQSNRGTSNPSKSNQEEIISLLKRIQSSISKGESRGIEEKNSDESSGSKPLTKAILDVLEKSRKKTEGDTNVKQEPPKRHSASGPRELKEVAKNRGIKGYSKLRKSELLELIRSS